MNGPLRTGVVWLWVWAASAAASGAGNLDPSLSEVEEGLSAQRDACQAGFRRTSPEVSLSRAPAAQVAAALAEGVRATGSPEPHQLAQLAMNLDTRDEPVAAELLWRRLVRLAADDYDWTAPGQMPLSQLDSALDHFLRLGDLAAASILFQRAASLVPDRSKFPRAVILHEEVETLLRQGDAYGAQQVVTAYLRSESRPAVAGSQCGTLLAGWEDWPEAGRDDLLSAVQPCLRLLMDMLGEKSGPRSLNAQLRVTDTLARFYVDVGLAREALSLLRQPLRYSNWRNPLKNSMGRTAVAALVQLDRLPRAVRLARRTLRAEDLLLARLGRANPAEAGPDAQDEFFAVRVEVAAARAGRVNGPALTTAWKTWAATNSDPQICAPDTAAEQAGSYTSGVEILVKQAQCDLLDAPVRDRSWRGSCEATRLILEDVGADEVLLRWRQMESLRQLAVLWTGAHDAYWWVVNGKERGSDDATASPLLRAGGIAYLADVIPRTDLWRSLAWQKSARRLLSALHSRGGPAVAAAETPERTAQPWPPETADLLTFLDTESARMAQAPETSERIEAWSRRARLDQLCGGLQPDEAVVDLYRVPHSALDLRCAAGFGGGPRTAELVGLDTPEDCLGGDEYIAFVADRARCDQPRLVRIGDASAVDAALSRWRAEVEPVSRGSGVGASASAALRALGTTLWTPLQAEVEIFPRLIIVPDGYLSMVPWAAIPLPRDSFVLEKHTIRLMDDPFDLVLENHLEERFGSRSGALLVGGLDYDVEAREGSRRVAQRGRVMDMPGWPCFWSGLDPLPQTGADLRALQDLLGASGLLTAQILSGPDAGRPVVVAAMHRASVIHFGTHGVYPDSTGRCGASGRSEDPWAAGRLSWSGAPAGDPSLLSALALSGANLNVAAEAEPGVGLLTAWEIARMDLSKVQLVVLDACGTALGELSTLQGANSLRLAFRQAGVRHVVSTLTPIADGASRELLLDFYRGVLAGKPPPEALRDAQLAMLKESRAAGRGPRPERWAPWIVSGL